MCYSCATMTTERRGPERVGIRELRQNLSVYVRRVREEGRAYQVTERGEPVARLMPLEKRALSTYERMVAEGRISRAKRSMASLPPPLPSGPGTSASAILLEMRDEERW